MARANPRLIGALRETARRLRTGADYAWGHMGSCNCGLLAQTVTSRSREEIHRAALARSGDWDEQARDHCPGSGLPIDAILDALSELGLAPGDLRDLEDLSAPAVLRRAAPSTRRGLSRNVPADVVAYLEAWAELLEEQLAAQLPRYAARPVRDARRPTPTAR